MGGGSAKGVFAGKEMARDKLKLVGCIEISFINIEYGDFVEK